MDVENVEAARISVQKRFETFYISYLSKNDEVAVLFRCLSSGALHDYSS